MNALSPHLLPFDFQESTQVAQPTCTQATAEPNKLTESPYAGNPCSSVSVLPKQVVRRSRLQRQGFVNRHRKLLFVLMGTALVTYLSLVRAPWELSDRIVQCLQLSGLLFIFGGILGRILATLSIGGLKDRKIVKTELYSVCRNPLYFASFLMAIGVGLSSGRLDFTLLTGAGYLAIFYPMMLNEAKFLREIFEDFAAYEKEVPLFFPNFRLWEERKNFEISFPLVKRTMFDASLALPAIFLIPLLNAIS